MVWAIGILATARAQVPDPAAAPAAPAPAAPAYDVLPIFADYQLPTLGGVDPAQQREVQRQISEINKRLRATADRIRDGLKNDTAANDPEFDRWFRENIFARMTQLDDASLSSIGEQRYEFFRDYMLGAVGASRTRLLNLTFTTMRSIAEGNYHPAARTNAVLVMGRLNSVEGSDRGNPPDPYRPSFDYLVQLVQDVNAPGNLRIAALVGLESHISVLAPLGDAKLPAAARQQLITILLPLARGELGATDIDADLVHFVRRRAIQSLGLLGTPGADGSVATTLRTIIADPAADLLVRLDAVEAYGQLKFADATQAAALETARNIGALVAQAARADAALIDQWLRELEVVAQMQAAPAGQRRKGKGDVSMGSTTGSGSGSDKATIDDTGSAGKDSQDKLEATTDQANDLLPKYKRDAVRRRIGVTAHIARSTLKGPEDRVVAGLLKLMESAPGGVNSAEYKLIADLAEKMKSLKDISAADGSTPITPSAQPIGGGDVVAAAPTAPLSEQLRDALNAMADQIDQLLQASAPGGGAGAAGPAAGGQ